MQQSVPNPPHQVIHIVEAPNDKANIKDAYNAKAATVLGVLHIICGVIGLAAESAYLDSSSSSSSSSSIMWIHSFGPGIWIFFIFFISGGLAIGGARSGNKCLVVATMVMSIISALVAGILFLTSAYSVTHLSLLDIRYNRNYYNNPEDYHNFSYFKTELNKAESALKLLIAMGVMMLGFAIASASLTCKPLCCRSTNQGSYNPNQVPTSVLVNPNYNPNPNAQPLQTSVNPPAYEEVVGTGISYQRF